MIVLSLLFRINTNESDTQIYAEAKRSQSHEKAI